MNIDKTVTRETFATKGQWNKFLKMKKFFEKLIELKEEGYLFLVDDEIEKNPFINGYEMGFDNKKLSYKLVFIGCVFSLDNETPWIDVTMKELKKRIIPLKRAEL